jgi:ABC-2 type transport system permease protein
MNRGLLLKAMRETWPATALLAAAMAGVEAILAFALPTVFDQLSAQLMTLEFFRSILSALLGTDVGTALSPEALRAITWVHPVVLTILWTHAIILATRVPAGEIDRGTIDILLSLPVSRWQSYRCELVVIAAAGTVLVTAAAAGNVLGNLAADARFRQDILRLAPVVTNLWCLYLAVAGVSCLISAFAERRGRAMAAIFALLVASFLLNFLAQFWSPARAVAFLSVLDYHRPLAALQRSGSDAWPLGDLAVLLAIGAASWTAGGLWLARRDIRTV